MCETLSEFNAAIEAVDNRDANLPQRREEC